MVINPSLSAIANVVALINASNVLDTPLLESQVTLGLPTAATGTAGAKNTDLPVAAFEGQGLTGDTVINYNRLALTTGVTTVVDTFVQGNAESDAELLARIATANGLRLDQLNWAVAPVVTPGGEPFEAQVGIDDGSLLYTGANLTVTITMDAETDVEALFGGEQDGFDAASGV